MIAACLHVGELLGDDVFDEIIGCLRAEKLVVDITAKHKPSLEILDERRVMLCQISSFY